MNPKKFDNYWDLRVRRFSYVVGHPLLAIARIYSFFLPQVKQKTAEYHQTGSMTSIAVISGVSTGTVNLVLAYLWKAHIIKTTLVFVAFIGFCFSSFLLGVLTLRFLYEAGKTDG